MKELKEDIETVTKGAQKFVEAELQLMQLKAVGETSSLVSFIFSRFLFTIMSVIAYATLVISVGLYLNQLMNSSWMGLSIAGIGSSALIGILYLFRKVLIEYPMQNYLIKNLTQKLGL